MTLAILCLLWLALVLRHIARFREFDRDNRAEEIAREQRGTAT